MTSLPFLCWDLVGAVAAVITLPGSVELVLLSCASFLPSRRRPPVNAPGIWRVAVVVPAHDEEANISACVQSLLKASPTSMHTDVFVVADNCTDNTASVAEAAGATVLRRSNATERGKGYALHFAFTYLEKAEYDCVLVVDADSEVESNFILEAAGAIRSGAAAVQARYLVRNLDDSSRTRLMGLALRAFNVVRPLGRNNLGLSVGILGNGFGLRTETLKKVPYLASSLVEDLEYHLALVRNGFRVAFVNSTTVYGEMPVKGGAVKTQRSRWEGGRLRMLIEKSPGLFREVLTGRLRCTEPLMELLLLPLAFHVTLLAVATSAPFLVVRCIGISGLIIVGLHLSAAVIVGGGGWRDAAALATAPFYIVWKLLLIPSLLISSRSDQAWVRTDRNEKTDVAPPAPTHKS